MGWIDTHTHLYDRAYDGDRDQVIHRAFASGVEAMVVVAEDLKTSLEICDLVARYDGLYAAVGIHPCEAANADPSDFIQLEKLLQEKTARKIVAVGEIGLDYYWHKDQKERQQDCFYRQLALAKTYDLPVIIHDREAHQDCLTVLQNFDREQGLRKPLAGVFHCYSGSLDFAQQIIKLGMMCGFDGPLTFKNAQLPPAVAQALPLDYLLIETDCPYLTPVPYRGRRNEPAFVRYVGEKLAELKQISPLEAADQTAANARRLFGLPVATRKLDHFSN